VFEVEHEEDVRASQEPSAVHLSFKPQLSLEVHVWSFLGVLVASPESSVLVSHTDPPAPLVQVSPIQQSASNEQPFVPVEQVPSARVSQDPPLLHL
jgi:hypothetical protein